MLLTIRESAHYMKVSEPTVRKAIKTRGLSVVRFGRAVRIDQGSLDAWIRKETTSVAPH
jgi:excisionase family DNA binding protein